MGLKLEKGWIELWLWWSGSIYFQWLSLLTFHHQLLIIPLLFFSCLQNQEKRGWVRFSNLNQCGDPRCEEAWDEGLYGESGDVVNSCLESCRAKLEMWNGVEFGNLGKTVAELQKRLEWLEL